MEAHHFCSSFSIPTSKIPSIPSQSSQIYRIPLGDRSLKLRQMRGSGQDGRGWSMVECAKRGSASEIERELKLKINSEDEEWMGIVERWRENCKERKGIVELMECLEREAIMGKDDGREPVDYNRRALIFDKSSRVFQALKESNTPHDS
ncbi:unnamed protein product [Ilex paraguariensis]|uniref:Uncharacterized protein n=1 Tax=Ilex paraguariensis TaxID=185542 RepID=A0ABC8QVS9_9AQUA